MGEFKSALVQRERMLPGIHGLRGIAALAVILFHVVHVVGIRPPDLFQFIERDFGYGVHLFFILSAFSLMHSTAPRVHEPDWLSTYLIKRFFRIAPLFYFMIATFIVFGLFKVTGLKDLNKILLNLTFSFGFVPVSSIVWGGWSVGVEMIFYGIFPVLLLLIKTHRSAVICLILSIVVSSALRSALHVQLMKVEPTLFAGLSYYTFPSNMCFFVMGIYVYLLSKFYVGRKTLFGLYAPIAAIAIIGTLVCFDAAALRHSSVRLDIVLWGLGLSALCAWQGNQPSGVIANYVLEYLGERSFSMYLLHPVVLQVSKEYLLKVYSACSPALGSYSYFICASVALIMLLVVSEFTYRFVEVPGINLGRRLIASRNRQAFSSPPSVVVNEH